MFKTIKGYLIDVVAKEIKPIEIQYDKDQGIKAWGDFPITERIECVRFNSGNCLIVEEDVRQRPKDIKGCFVIGLQQPVFNNAVILGVNSNGYFKDTTVLLSDLDELIHFEDLPKRRWFGM